MRSNKIIAKYYKNDTLYKVAIYIKCDSGYINQIVTINLIFYIVLFDYNVN